MRRRHFISLFSALVASACARKRHRAASTPPPARHLPPPEIGIASWYGHPYHGRRTASGEVYDMEQMTAAHRTLSFGTRVRVVNLDNGKSCEVRINDRGPFIDGRVIDLSHAAAGEIAMVGPGTAHVRLEILAQGQPPPGEPAYAVQAGVFTDKKNADRMRRKLEKLDEPVSVIEREATRTQWKVLVGRSSTPEEAASLAERVRALSPTALVVRIDDLP
jgi:rare lipoprotein A